MKLEHIAFNVAEPEKVAEWYQAHLGLKLAKVIPTPTFTAYFLVDEHQSMLEFYHNPIAPVPDYAALHPANLHVAFHVADVEAETNRLTAAGATKVGDKTALPNGTEYSYVRDPWGLALQIIKRPAPLLG